MANQGNRSLRRLLIAITGSVLFGLVLLPQIKASDMDQKVIYHFDQRVQVPGAVLEPGTYVIKRANWGGDPHVMRVFDKDERRVFATALTISVERPRPTSRVEVRFYETRGATPPAIESYFYPGRTIGEQFLYPKSGPVLMGLATETTENNTSSSSFTPAAKEPEPEVVKEEEKRENETTEIAAAAPPPEPPAQTQTAPAPEPPQELPATGSQLPLLALMGVLAMAGGAGLKLLVKQTS